MEGHIAVTCRMILNHPSTAAMRFTANYLTTCYIWTRPLTHSHRQPSASSRVLYCGHSTQYSHLVVSAICQCQRILLFLLLTSRSAFCLCAFHTIQPSRMYLRPSFTFFGQFLGCVQCCQSFGGRQERHPACTSLFNKSQSSLFGDLA